MGTVLKGYDPELDRQVAIKVLHADPTGRQGPRLRREAQALAKLGHPNVVSVFEVGIAEGQLFVVMELVKGQTLRQWQSEEAEPHDWKECVRVYLQAGRGLAAAHAKGLVHRDFKPGNAMLDEEGHTRVLDFGLARKGDEEDSHERPDTGGIPSMIERARTDRTEAAAFDLSLTKTGAVLGTPAYMPPEHEVTLNSFYLAKTELTNAQYALYREANPEVPEPPGWQPQYRERYGQPDQPVMGLTWYEAKAYCDWAGFVLPTEAQWEYAATAGTTSPYWFGDEPEDLPRFGWFDANTGHRERGQDGGRPHAVATKGANATGLYDMHGNMWEWTFDADEPYATSVRAGDGLRKQPVDANRVIRGGGWSNTARYARAADRSSIDPGRRSFSNGFRPAQGIP